MNGSPWGIPGSHTRAWHLVVLWNIHHYVEIHSVESVTEVGKSTLPLISLGGGRGVYFLLHSRSKYHIRLLALGESGICRLKI